MRKLRMAPAYAALVLVSLLFLFPFYWVVINSLESVEGMSLKPPALYPAEAKSIGLTVEAKGRVVTAEGNYWLRLARSDDLLGNAKGGAYYLQLDEKGKPSQLVSWFPGSEVHPAPLKLDKIDFTNVPVHEIEGAGRAAIVAKAVRQQDNRFDELLFTVPPTAKTFAATGIRKNVEHHEIREFVAHWENYPKTLKGPEATIGGQSAGFLLFMRNSLFISVMTVIGQVLASSLVAFGFARMNFKGRETWFVLLLATLMVPAQVTLIPLFTIYKSVGWIDTFLPLIVPAFTGGAFNIFLIRQFLLTVPKELDESASIDGANPLRIYWSVILPICTPVLIVVGLFTFVASWQDVMGPLIYLDNPNYRTVTLGLEYFRSPYVDNRPLLMTGAVLAMVPVAALFAFGQRYIMSGIATTGLK